MKVLFAIGGTGEVSARTANKYYEKFGETLEYKNQFSFKTLLDEVKREKTYDVIVISEELDQYKTKDIEQLDRKLFSYVDSITDEAQDAEIVYICADGRTKDDKFIGRLFSIGIYNILIGDDRSLNSLCEIIKKPKTKKEAKEYLNIDSGSISETGIMRDDEVDEAQMMHILNYYDQYRNKPEEYVGIFDKIAVQYSRAQLKVIASYLPKEVQEVIYNEPKYKFLSEGIATTSQPNNDIQKMNNISVKKTERKHSQDFFGVFKKSKEKIMQNVGALSKKNQSKDDKKSESEIDKNQAYIEKIKAEAEAEADAQENIAEKIRLEIEERQRKEIEEREKAEAAVKQQQELAEQARKEAEIKQQKELEEQARKEAEIKQQKELAEQARKEVEIKQQQELAEQARKEAEIRQQKELEEQARKEAEIKRQKELEEMAKKEQIIENVEVAVNNAKFEDEIDVIIDEEIVHKNQSASSEVRHQQELEEQARKEAEAKQRELEEQARKEAEAKQRELEEQARKEAEAKQRELEEQARKEAEIKQQQELEEQARKEAEVPKEQESVNVQSNVSNVINASVISQNNISEEQRRFQEEQRKLAIEQEKIKKVQAELEEEKRKLREEQARIANQKTRVELEPQIPTRKTYEATSVTPLNYKKMVVFVGANKAGTTFMTNAVAHYLSNKKILTSIVDMTRDKNMYYIYTQMEKELINITKECMQRLSDGEDVYLPINKSLKVYTTIPGTVSDVRRSFKHKSIIETVKNNSSITIVDADFTTPIDYFEQANEIYIIQDMDILKIQEARMFLREMKNRNMDMDKIKVIVNKYVKCGLSQKDIIESLSYYRDPEMTFTDKLLNNKVMYETVPFDVNNYTKYTEALCKGNMNFKGYSLDFVSAINEIGEQVYPQNGMATSKKRRRTFWLKLRRNKNGFRKYNFF